MPWFKGAERRTMDINGQVGAGKVWQALSSAGPQTLTQLKKKVNGSSDLLGFALGWLAREDKIDIIPDKKSFRAQLK
jgi:Winged helix-turn-helix domain (DUF2582)